MKAKDLIGFECYEIIDEVSQPVYSIRDIHKDTIRFRLKCHCPTQQHAAKLLKEFPFLTDVIQEVATEIGSPHKEFIDKIVMLSE